ncbi:MAG: SRPBCC domain-containing protein [Chloroflexi bacterium]|nr:SRPBCC domain-containing protein [Chloroflexota bacterium]
MSQTLHIQVAINHAPEAIFRALTESSTLTTWFAEYADVSIPDSRYNFWGRFTPETPDYEQGKHPLLESTLNRSFKYGWRFHSEDTNVQIILEPLGEQTVVVIQQTALAESPAYPVHANEDFWFLSLENLRRFLDGKSIVRCDFSGAKTGDIQHTIEINGTPEAVFDTLIRPEQLNRWIASNASVEPYVGGRYDYGWNGAGPVKILELVPNEKLATLWPSHSDTTDGGGDTIVTWTLEESGGKTRLTIIHSGFASDADTEGLQWGWLNFSNWIRSIVEYGDAWQPPVSKLREGTESYYSAAINAAQAALVMVEAADNNQTQDKTEPLASQ